MSVPGFAIAPVEMIPVVDNAATPDGALTSEAIAAQVTQVQQNVMLPQIKKHVAPATGIHPGAEGSLGTVGSARILASTACDVVQQPRSRFLATDRTVSIARLPLHTYRYRPAHRPVRRQSIRHWWPPMGERLAPLLRRLHQGLGHWGSLPESLMPQRCLRRCTTRTSAIFCC